MEQPGTDLTKKEIKLAKQDIFLRAFRSNLFNVTQACLAVPIGRTTFYRWYDDDECFREKLEICKEEMIDLAETALLQKIKKGDTISIIFFLKTIGKRRGYIENPMINLQSPIASMSKEHIDAVIEAGRLELPAIHIKQIENHPVESDSLE